MKIKNFLSIICTAGLLLITACSRNNDIPEPDAKNNFTNGYLIANEGSYGIPNAEVTFVSKDFGQILQNIFKGTNEGEQLGDVLQDVGIDNNYAYLVLNNSNKVKVVDRFTFIKAGEITEQLLQPRYIAFLNNSIYVTNNATFVNVYDSRNGSFIKKINLNAPAERIVAAGTELYVQNAAYGIGNKISYLNAGSNTLNSQFTVPNGQIQKLIADSGKAYAIASDTTSPDSYIYQISGGAITKTIPLTGIQNAMNLCLEGGNFYFTSGLKIYKMSTSATTAPTAPIVTATQSVPYSGLYGFNVLDGKIFTADANGFTTASKVTVYDTSGNLMTSFNAGIGTNGFYKN